MSRVMQAILWMMLTGILAVCINTIARYMSTDFHPFQLVFFYNFLGLVFFMPYVLQQRVSLKTERMGLYCIRAGLEFTAFSFLFAALSRMPFPAVTALSFTSPLFGCIAAILFLKEKSSWRRWAALLVGFSGVLIVARPGASEFNINAILVIIAAMEFAMCGICIKKLTKTEPNIRIVFYMLFCTSLVAAPFAMKVWVMPGLEHISLLVALGVLVAGVQYAVSQAFSRADMTTILPVFFLNLVWSSIAAYLVFDEVVHYTSILGAVVIIGATIYNTRTAHRETLEEVVATEQASAGN